MLIYFVKLIDDLKLKIDSVVQVKIIGLHVN